MMKCLICNSENIAIFIDGFKSSMMSDGKKLDLPLKKYICNECSFIFNNKIDINLEKFYESYRMYSLETEDKEHTYIINNNSLTQSQMYFEWILSLGKKYFDNVCNILEIGCGKGDLLEKLSKLPNVQGVYGIDLAASAVKLAKQRNLHVEQKKYEELSETIKYDLIVSMTVMEHVVNPIDFLERQKNLLNENGLIVLSVPIQDTGSYDILMVDHLWHFNSKHVEYLINKLGLFILRSSYEYGPINNLGLYILCKKEDIFYFAKYDKHNLDFLKNVFRDMDNFLKSNQKKKIFLYGNGEYSKILQAYTEISHHDSIQLVEDNSKYMTVGSKTFEQLASEFCANDEYIVILGMNMSYHGIVMSRFAKRGFEKVKYYVPQTGKLIKGG